MKQYQTIQGDMWDSIAKKVYGTEKAMELLMQANPEYLDTAVFGARAILHLPQFAEQEKKGTESVPPWRRQSV